MAISAKKMSLAELERLLASKKGQLESLTKRREKLQQELEKVDQEIASIQGKGRASRGPAKRRVRRRRNQPPLRDVVTGILSKNKKGLGLNELSEKVKATGYKSSSSNFNNVVYQCLYNTKAIQHDKDNGVYKLKT